MIGRLLSGWIAVVLAIGVTLAAGGVHGVISNRWGPRPSMLAAADRLHLQLPQRIGNWVLLREDKMPPQHQNTLQCEGYIFHHYEHVENRARVSVFVLVGPHGPTAVHTPEICYSTSNHTPLGQREILQMEDANGVQHKLWQLSFKANTLEAGDQQVTYAWSTGGAWQAAESPRYEYAGAPYLYKLQLSGPLKSDASDFDACGDFLKGFLAELAQRMAEPAATLPDRS